MPWSSEHITKWLKPTTQTVRTSDGVEIPIWELKHEADNVVLKSWAKHFRNHYCLDTEIDSLRSGTGLSRKQYLENIKFPDQSNPPGPSIRSGDFAEILIADYLQYILKYWVPRGRYRDKSVRNESDKGCDIIGFKFLAPNKSSSEDELAIYEIKAQFTGNKCNPRLQDAVNDSAKDILRKAETLNAIKQRFLDKSDFESAKNVERFQNIEDKPYKEVHGAVAVFATNIYDKDVVKDTNTETHPASERLILLAMYGSDLMKLTHQLYELAANDEG